MSKKIFSEKERKHLSTNRYDLYMSGKTPREIFEANEFDVSIIGMKRVEQSTNRWKKAYEKDIIIGLADSRELINHLPPIQPL